MYVQVGCSLVGIFLYLEPIFFYRNDESDGNHLLNIHKSLEIIAISYRLFFDIRVILCIRTNQFYGPVGNRVLIQELASYSVRVR